MKRFLVGMCMFVSLNGLVYGQQNDAGGVDYEIIHFGFTFQYVLPELKIVKSGGWSAHEFPHPELTGEYRLRGISDQSRPGVGLGLVSDLRLSDHVNLRLTPTVVLAEKRLRYDYEEADAVEKKVQSASVDFPLGMKLKSERRNNFSAYLLAGVRYSLDLSKRGKSGEDVSAFETSVRTRLGYLSYEAAIGFDLYFPFFKVSPEIKLSHSAGNVFKREGNSISQEFPYATPLDKLFLRSLQFSLYFE